MSFCKAWGYERLDVINLFAYRATDPREILTMKAPGDPVGPENQEIVEEAVKGAGAVVCAWGAHGDHLQQNDTMMGWLDSATRVPERWALGFTKNGQPKHPLYLRAGAKLVPVV